MIAPAGQAKELRQLDLGIILRGKPVLSNEGPCPIQ
jgi:hypothetical protein